MVSVLLRNGTVAWSNYAEMAVKGFAASGHAARSLLLRASVRYTDSRPGCRGQPNSRIWRGETVSPFQGSMRERGARGGSIIKSHYDRPSQSEAREA